jgi:3-dehydroquinate synthetase
LIHTGFLKTLDQRNINNGLAEMIKKAALFDKDYLEQLKNADIKNLLQNE